MRCRAGGHEQVEIGQRRRPQRRLAGLGRRFDRVDRLARAVLARRRQPAAGRLPQVGDRALLADQHARVPAPDRRREASAAAAGRDDVRAEVAERLQPPAALQPAEAPEASARRVFEEDTLDRILGAKLEDLIQ